MPLRADLHTHSSASDGALSPSALVARAAKAGLDLLSLTDHDTTGGIAEARLAACSLRIGRVAGVEVSVTWERRTVHIVGLGVDPAAPGLRKGLQRLTDYRRIRAEEMGRRLAKAGIHAVYDDACALSNGLLVGRVHFARALVARGYAESVRQVFKHYLVRGKPGYVAGEWASLSDAVSWILGAGGQAVIAHPARYGFTRAKMLRLLGEFREHGGEGIEVVCGSHSRDDAFVFARHAREHRLFASVGSDFHRPDGPLLELGRLPPLPEGCTPIWAGWCVAESRQAFKG